MNSEKEKVAIERLKAFEPEDGYHLSYSGGKDSDCIKILAYLAGVKFEAVHSLTTVDAPETVSYVKSQTDVRIEEPKKTMWQLIVEKGIPPTRVIRYCHSELKGHSGKCRVVVSGVRWAESKKRAISSGLVMIMDKPKTTQKEAAKRQLDYRINKQGGVILSSTSEKNRVMVLDKYKSQKVIINPIIDWSDNDVWKFLHYYGCDSNPLYQCGFKRIGCIGCPMARKHRYFEFERYPDFKEMYLTAFEQMLETRKRKGLSNRIGWKTATDVFKWWMEEDFLQLTFDDLAEMENNRESAKLV